MKLLRLQVVLAGLWLGGLAAVGLIGAPTVFALIPHKLAAAAVASRMFHTMALSGVVLGALLLFIERRRDASTLGAGLLLVMGALFFDVLGEFVVVPQLLAAAAAGSPAVARWHVFASLAYLGQALCVLAYAWLLPSRLAGRGDSGDSDDAGAHQADGAAGARDAA